jgi:hypothetical protein
VYEYLAGERDDAPIDEFELCIERVNAVYADSKSNCRDMNIPVFDPRPGQLLLERIEAYLVRRG